MQRYKQTFLGSLLVEENIITQEELDDALKTQSEFKGKKGLLGELMVQKGYCTEDDIARIIAKRAGVQSFSLESYPVDPKAVSTISAEVARRYRALPVSFEGDRLVTAMHDPTDLMVIDDLRILTGHDIKPVAVSDSELEAAIRKNLMAGMVFEKAEEEGARVEEIAFDQEDAALNPAVQLANMLLSQAAGARASDIHIEPFENFVRVRYRIDGVLHDMPKPPRSMHGSLVSRIKVMANMDIAKRRVPQDGRMSLRFEDKVIDFRVASLPTSHGERLTLRLLDQSGMIISLDELGISPEIIEKFRQVIKLPYGLALVTGPTGSGKTTTLYAALDAVDKVGKNVITVEDPVEYKMDGTSQVQINPQAGLTFGTGLRYILRSDPDIIMIGEIRDRETARIAVESAMTGHLVFSSLHTNDAAGAVSRLTEMGVEPFLTASALKCAVSQRLVRVLCPQCKESYQLSRGEWKDITGSPLEDAGESIELFRSVGCMRCNNTGYRGRIGVYEMLFTTETIQQLILNRRPTGEINKAAVAAGMQTIRQDSLKKVKQGITSLEEVARVIM